MTIEGTVSKKGKLYKDFIAGILEKGKDKHFLSPAQLKYKKMLAKLMKKMNKKKGGKKSKRNIKMARKFRRTRRKRRKIGGTKESLEEKIQNGQNWVDGIKRNMKNNENDLKKLGYDDDWKRWEKLKKKYAYTAAPTSQMEEADFEKWNRINKKYPNQKFGLHKIDEKFWNNNKENAEKKKELDFYEAGKNKYKNLTDDKVWMITNHEKYHETLKRAQEYLDGFQKLLKERFPDEGGRRRSRRKRRKSRRKSRRKRGGQDADSEFTTCMTTAEKTIAASIERGKEDAKKRGKLYKPSKVIPGLYKNRCCKAANKRRNCWKPDDFDKVDKDMCVADGDTWKDGACIENGKGAQNISYEITGSELDKLVPGGRRRRKSRKKRRKSRRKSRRRRKKRTRRRRRKKR